jgi:hypothetical protein
MNDAARHSDTDDISRELAGWYLLAADLRHVIAATRSLQHQQRQFVTDPALSRSLWTSAHIAYARCFVDGPTVKLDPAMFDGLPDGHAQAHRFLLFTANKHLAQPLNPFLQVRVGVEYDADERPIGIKYTPSANDTTRASPEDAANLAWLAAQALKHVETIETNLAGRLKNQLLASPATTPTARARA